jgi:hypothetical protein
LLAGHGIIPDYLDNYDTGQPAPAALPGDAGYPYLSCVECSVNIDFNLVGLQYQSFQTNTAWLTTNPQDTRALLYSESSYQHEGSYYGSRSQTFYVATVPEPASWGMLLAGLAWWAGCPAAAASCIIEFGQTTFYGWKRGSPRFAPRFHAQGDAYLNVAAIDSVAFAFANCNHRNDQLCIHHVVDQAISHASQLDFVSVFLAGEF